MISLIEQHRPEFATLCERFGVHSLEVFGSAADGDFDAARSDIDLVSANALNNPYFIAAVNQSRQTVYASARTQAA
jgi:predicted nucleotidyltransferase